MAFGSRRVGVDLTFLLCFSILVVTLDEVPAEVWQFRGKRVAWLSCERTLRSERHRLNRPGIKSWRGELQLQTVSTEPVQEGLRHEREW